MRKLDVPLKNLDDWDLLQAAFEAMLEEIGTQPGFDPAQIINKEFPAGQSKKEQETRLKLMLSQRNEWDIDREPLLDVTPPEILEDALRRIQNEVRLSQTKTIRALIYPYSDFSQPHPDQKNAFTRLPWTRHFNRDFWAFLAEKKMNGEGLITAVKKEKLQPGEERILHALKKASPEGLTVQTLMRSTAKDNLSELETPRGSIDAWLKGLKDKGLVRADEKRPKNWFFVKDYKANES